MFIDIGNCFWVQMNIEAFVNMAFSANVQIDDSSEQDTSDNAAPGNPRQNTVFSCQECLFTGPLPSNGCPIVTFTCVAGICFPTRCLAMGIHVTV
jgi:hypothetical protein